MRREDGVTFSESLYTRLLMLLMLLIPGCEPDAFGTTEANLTGENSLGCAPGYTLCGKKCADLQNDPRSCGSCSTKCQGGELCTNGLCGSPSSITPLTTSVSVFQVSGGVPNGDCVQSSEGSPERSLNDGTLFLGYQTTGAGGPLYNWATASSPTLWGTTYRTYPWVAGTNPCCDPWSTTGPAVGMDYISEILWLNDGTYQHGGIGIVPFSPANMRAGSWPLPMDFGVLPMPQQGFFDGPAIHYDKAAPILWATARAVNSPNGSANGHWLWIYKNCGAGQPGGANCPVTSARYAVPNAGGHPNVVVNPCTHDGVLAYRDPTTNAIKLKFYTPDGVEVNPSGYNVRVGRNWGGASACTGSPNGNNVPKCTGLGSTDCSAVGPGCMKIIERVHVATKWTPTRCLAYVTYGFKCDVTGPDGQYHLKSALDIVDITNEMAPFNAVAGYVSSSCAGDASNDFEPTTTANEFTTHVGWFYYSQWQGEPCWTTYVAWLDANSGLSGMTSYGAISGPFPTVLFSAPPGTGDYVNIAKAGLPGGTLFPTWSQAVPLASGSCVSCLGTQYGLRIMGATILGP